MQQQRRVTEPGAKYAILYSVSAVSVAESDKHNDTEKTVEFKVPNKPGEPFL